MSEELISVETNIEDIISKCIGGNEVRRFDQNNRITIPGNFRERFGNKQVYLLKNVQSKSKSTNCILAYTPEEYYGIFRRLEESFKGEMLDKAKRRIAANSDRVILDKDGRITLKTEFMEFADLCNEEEAVISCQPTKIEIWNKSKWEIFTSFDNQTDEDEGEQPDFSQVSL